MFWINCLLQGDRTAELAFDEDGNNYKEKVTFDDISNTTLIHVPKHGKIRQQYDYLIDHNLVSVYPFFAKLLPSAWKKGQFKMLVEGWNAKCK